MAFGLVGGSSAPPPYALVHWSMFKLHVVGFVHGGQPKLFAGPSPQVQALAAWAAKRAVHIGRCVDARALAARAFHQFDGFVGHASNPVQEHKVSSNAMSAVFGCTRSCTD